MYAPSRIWFSNSAIAESASLGIAGTPAIPSCVGSRADGPFASHRVEGETEALHPVKAVCAYPVWIVPLMNASVPGKLQKNS